MTARERAEAIPHVHFQNGCGWCDRVTAAVLAHAEAVLAEAQAELSERKAGVHADATGHLHRCAKIHGVWQCADGCAVQERDALQAALKQARGALQKAADTFADLRIASDLLGRSLVAESCRIAEDATRATLTALRAGEGAN